MPLTDDMKSAVTFFSPIANSIMALKDASPIATSKINKLMSEKLRLCHITIKGNSLYKIDFALSNENARKI